jgi:hypothetical protein
MEYLDKSLDEKYKIAKDNLRNIKGFPECRIDKYHDILKRRNSDIYEPLSSKNNLA